MVIAAWGVVLFFAISWSVGVIINPQFRVKATLAALMHWWVLIGITLISGVSVFHLLWLMPIAIVICTAVMMVELRRVRTRVMSIFAKSAVLIWPAAFLVVQAAR